MSSLPPEDVLPVLVADLADDDSRDVLEAAAFTGGKVYVPLETAPVNASQHVLEVHIPGAEEPLYFLAQPLGPPTDDGFPLRIAPMPDAPPPAPDRLSPVPADGVVRGRRSTTSMTLTASHTADLSHVGPLPEEPADVLVGRAIAGGKLTIEQVIGRGGVGAVYKARHRELRMPVAVKVLHESFQHDIDFCRRFYAEALAASRLDHPSITRVIDFGQEPDGLLYFAMEFLAGEELRSVLEKEGPQPAERIAEIMMQVCAALSHAHARGIVHRDIKPENLVLVPGQDDDGKPTSVVKVCDFGIAQHRALATVEGEIAGTPEYMSPEQCRGDELDARSDVYAVGVVLYELATGQVPFTAERPQSILNKQQFTPPVAPSLVRQDIDPLLEKIILKALEKEPEKRQQSMRELRAELRELLSPIVTDASPPPSSVGAVPSGGELVPQSVRAAAAAAAARRAAHAAVSSEDPPESRGEASPAWLERGPVYAGGVAPPMTLGTPAALSPNEELAEAIAQGATAWLKRFTATPDKRAFAQLAQRLDGAIRVLAARGDATTLWAISSTLHGIAMEGTQALGSRAHTASRVLRVFEDPSILASVAERLLLETGKARDHARKLLLHAGVAGAYGLYGARIKLAAEANVRQPFVATLAEFGPKAWPIVRAALEKLLASMDNPRATELAEDLLLCVPVVGDESAGHVVTKYLRVNASGVCCAATASIVKLWADRAKPLLVGMIQSKDDVVRVAGIAGLRQLNAIDEHVVPRLQAILTRRLPAGDEVRAAAAMALGHTSPSARPPAISVLSQLLTPPREGPIERAAQPAAANAALSREDAVILAAARSLLQVGGKNYRGLIAERAERSSEPLRGQLRRVLAAV